MRPVTRFARGALSAPPPTPDPYDPTVNYSPGAYVTHAGSTWVSVDSVARHHYPQGGGSGSTADRDLLLARRSGFASSVTGGYAGATRTVTTNANSGAGSLREALEDAAALWIVFDWAALPANPTIEFTGSTVACRGAKTIDGRGGNLTIKGRGIVFDSVARATNTANLIVAYVNAGPSTVADEPVLYAGGRGTPASPRGGADLVWFHHVSITDFRDTAVSGGFFGANVSRWTCSWVNWHDIPGPVNYALADPATDASLAAPYLAGKCLNFGFDKTLAQATEGGDQLTPGNGQLTVHHCQFARVGQRAPKSAGTNVHHYNNLHYRWGQEDGTFTAAVNPDTESQVLVENNIADPYNNGDTHHFSTYAGTTIVVTNDSNHKGFVIASNAGATKRKYVGNDMRRGAVFQHGERLPAEVFVPAPGYLLLPADNALQYDVLIGAGNVQPWVLA